MEENWGSEGGPERGASGSATQPPGAVYADVRGGPGDEHRSPVLTTCPFFRRLDVDQGIAPPVEAPHRSNRCAAFGEPTAQSARQQQLVCLTRAHIECPRYLRGAVLLQEGVEPSASPPPRHASRPILAALALLAVSAGASFAFVVARGGLTVPLGAGATQVAAITASPAPSSSQVAVAPTARSTPTAIRTAPPTPHPTLPPTPPPTLAPTQAPTSAPTPAPTPVPRPTSDRYALLRPCPDRSDCWTYTVRSGDNLFSIANYFGHRLETVYRLNPWARTTSLRPGQQLVLPPPTR